MSWLELTVVELCVFFCVCYLDGSLVSGLMSIGFFINSAGRHGIADAGIQFQDSWVWFSPWPESMYQAQRMLHAYPVRFVG